MPNEDGHEKRLRELRDRLYSRGTPLPEQVRNELPDRVFDAPRDFAVEDIPPQPGPEPPHTFPPMTRTRRSYRTTLIVAGLIFFVVALVLSGSFLLFGRNMISGENITVNTSAPLAVGGGEVIPLSVTVANENAVPIESATLIIEYPYGTQSPDEAGKELFRERKPLERMNPDTVQNVELRARVFGEENEEKTIKISIEYRVEGSNATFYKEADPVRFKISSSPVVLSVANVEKSSSGQDLTFTLEVGSNSPSPIADVLLKAEYPAGFSFTESEPSTVSGNDTWDMSDLEPGAKETVVVHGTLSGNQDETKVFRFSVGAPNDRDRSTLASLFMTATEEVQIENPFLDVGVTINGDDAEEVSVAPGDIAQVSVTFKNTLSTTVYDGRISVDLSGNGLDDSEVDTSGGFYDSSNDTITWSSNDTASLKSIGPGRSSTVTFEVRPSASADRTPQIDFKVNVEANRVSGGSAAEALQGSAERSIRVQSEVELNSSARHSIGSFNNTGPVPPVAEEVTTYGVRLHVKNGSNAVSDGTVTFTLPAYVTWLSLTTSQPTFSYDPQTRTVSWDVGDLKAAEAREAEFQISLKPSVSQVGQVVTLVNGQRFRATDRFTGTTISADAAALTTQLFADPEHEEEDGRVQAD